MIIGAVLITGGVAIGGVTGWLIEKSMLAGLPDVATQNTLGPGENITRTIMAKTGESFTVIARTPSPSHTIATIVYGPDGKIVLQSQGQEANPVLAIKDGPHVVTVRNEGSEPVTTTLLVFRVGVFSDNSVEFSPFLKQVFSFLGYIVLAGVLVLAGIIVLIIGAVKYFRERKRPAVGV
ncbi:hypothetical protein NTE_02741 [Candidatus Nitrososphaera evergladensis SR1]|uniref:Uncharacterized protein n=2 Tax=Nitrososphaera TaxID=497726 RepID=A0A075MUI9_9ARCH|nr:hypothetical protein NTE_02741 [Candidatus Nitrososphaera evergladensis SR1]